jgi:hypothetical protein
MMGAVACRDGRPGWQQSVECGRVIGALRRWVTRAAEVIDGGRVRHRGQVRRRLGSSVDAR